MSRIASVEDFVKKRLVNMGKPAAKLDANLIREGWKTLKERIKDWEEIKKGKKT